MSKAIKKRIGPVISRSISRYIIACERNINNSNKHGNADLTGIILLETVLKITSVCSVFFFFVKRQEHRFSTDVAESPVTLLNRYESRVRPRLSGHAKNNGKSAVSVARGTHERCIGEFASN